MKFVNDFESIGHSLAALCGNGSERCQPKQLKTLYQSETKGPLGVVGCMGALFFDNSHSLITHIISCSGVVWEAFGRFGTIVGL